MMRYEDMQEGLVEEGAEQAKYAASPMPSWTAMAKPSGANGGRYRVAGVRHPGCGHPGRGVWPGVPSGASGSR